MINDKCFYSSVVRPSASQRSGVRIRWKHKTFSRSYLQMHKLQFKEPRSPICFFLFYSCFLNEKWLFETLKEDVNHLQIVSGQEYID